MALTKKQEEFARLVALDGLNYSDAYRKVYDTQATPSVLWANACKVAKNDKVATRIKELIENQLKEQLRTKEESARRLAKISDQAFAESLSEQTWQGRASARATAIKAEQQLGKIMGFETPTKIESKIEIIFADEIEEFGK